MSPANTPQHGFLLSRDSFDNKQRSEINLWVHTDQGPAKLIIEHERHTFFVVDNDTTRKAVHQAIKLPSNAYEYRPLPLTTFQHEQTAALYFHNVHDFFDARAQLDNAGIEHFESDFRLEDRYLMERFCYGSIVFTGTPLQKPTYTEYRDVTIKPSAYTPALRVLSLDIECSMEGELYSIGFYGEINNAPFQQVIMIGQPEAGAAEWITWVNDEKALLVAFIDLIQETDPDIIIGWNVVNFDFRLLIERAQLHRIKLYLGRGRKVASWRTNKNDDKQGFIRIPGRSVIDGIDSLKTATYSFPSFSLENVARTLLQKGKKTDDVTNRATAITNDFHHNKQKLAHYNLEDCILVWEIFQHTQLLDFLIFRSHLTGLELDKIGGSVAAFTNLYLPHLHRAGYIAPNLPKDGGLASPGGYVMDSLPGLYKHVLVLDFKSLYPSIIRTFKIDPLGLIEGLKHPQSAIPGFKGALFSREKHFLPGIITQLWEQRDQAKKNHDAPRSQAIKIIMNSFYGVLGSGGCRFYDTRLASSITMRGHEIMQQTAKWIESNNHKVIYGDTDSIFVLLDENINDDQANTIGKQLAKDITAQWREKLQADFQLDSYLELEFETHYTQFLMPTIRGSEYGSKKRYAGIINKAGKPTLIFKGLESVRSDWTELAKEFQHTLYSMIFAGEDPTDFILTTVNNTLSGTNDKKLIYRKRLRRNLSSYVKNVPPHVKAARLADSENEKRGLPLAYQSRGTIAYVITINGPEPVEYHQSALDYEHYVERQLLPVAEGILPFINLDFEQLVSSQLGLF